MTSSRGVLRVVRDVGAVLFPASCNSCEGVVDGGDWLPLLCADCADAFPTWDAPVCVPAPLAGGHALARFEGPARDLLVALKYQGLLRAGRGLGRRMAAAPGVQPLFRRADLLVPVPLHWRRRWVRGHNQAAALARNMKDCGRAPAMLRALRRRRATKAQVGLDRSARRANVSGAFFVRRRHRRAIQQCAVLLIDDVVTTGATAAAAAAALRVAGAEEVWLYAAAWAKPS